MSAVEWRRVDGTLLYPPFRLAVTALLDEAWAAGFQFWPISGFRDYPEQLVLFQQGRTRPGVVVTRARPGESSHNFGIALDVCLDGNVERAGLQPDYEVGPYAPLAPLAIRHGLVWGGLWGDSPHLQWPRYVSGDQLAPLRAAFEEGGLLKAWQHIDSGKFHT